MMTIQLRLAAICLTLRGQTLVMGTTTPPRGVIPPRESLSAMMLGLRGSMVFLLSVTVGLSYKVVAYRPLAQLTVRMLEVSRDMAIPLGDLASCIPYILVWLSMVSVVKC